MRRKPLAHAHIACQDKLDRGVGAGSKVEVLARDPHNVTVADIVSSYLGYRRDPELLQRAMNLTSLPENWKTQLMLRAQNQV